MGSDPLIPIEGLLIDMRRRAEGRKAGWLRDLFDD
jgi:hypothetical protein